MTHPTHLMHNEHNSLKAVYRRLNKIYGVVYVLNEGCSNRNFRYLLRMKTVAPHYLTEKFHIFFLYSVPKSKKANNSMFLTTSQIKEKKIIKIGSPR